MHLKRIQLLRAKFPVQKVYPFNLPVFAATRQIEFKTPVTFFVGENGTGKSTLLSAITKRCGIQIWKGPERTRVQYNPFEDQLDQAIEIQWVNGQVPGSFFASQIFRNFTQLLDEWASADPGVLDYFGGKSLLAQSHGQSLMSFFKARFQIEGVYFLDEPETALSPRSQIELLQLLKRMSQAGHAQFVVATHSPILLACPDARIFSFDMSPIQPIAYEQTDYYQIYKQFMDNPETFI